VARKIFSVPHVLARVFDPKREEFYAQLDIDTVCPTSLGANLFLQAITRGIAGQEGAKS
jgi:trk system potassium uptake protein